MNSKKQFLKKSHLYLITDENIKAARKALSAGANIIQLRIKGKEDKFFLKNAFELRRITKSLKKILIINDRVDIALLVKADGVHLGKNDLPIKKVRKLLGKNKIIGVSTHSLKEAKEAIKAKVDYIGIGPAFATKTKATYKVLSLKVIKEIITFVDIPYFVIGGISPKNISILLKNNIDRVAVFSSIIQSDNPYLQTEKFIERLGI